MQRIPDQASIHTQAHSGEVKGLVFRDKSLYTVGDRTVKVWSERLQLEREISCAVDLSSLCLGEGSQLLIGGEDSKLRLWQSPLESELRVLGEQDGCVTTIARLGKLILSGSDRGTLFLWDERGVISQKLLGHAAKVKRAFMAGPTVAISASTDGTAKVWDLQTGKCQETLRAHPKGVLALAPHSNTHQFFSGGEEGDVRLWDLRKVERCVGTLHLDLGAITSLGLAGSQLGVGGIKRQVQMVDLKRLTQVSTLSLKNKYPTCLDIHRGRLAVGFSDGALHLQELPASLPMEEIPSLPGGWRSVYSHQGRERGRLFLFKAHEGPVTQLSFHCPYLLTRGQDGILGCYRLSIETSTVEEVGIIPNARGCAVGFLPHCRRIYTTAPDRLYLWDLDRSESFVAEYRILTGDEISAVASQSSILVLGTRKGYLHLYKAQEKQGSCLNDSLFSRLQSRSPIVALELSGDELFSLDESGTVTVGSLGQPSSTSHKLCGKVSPMGLFFSFLREKETLIIAYGGRILRFKREKGTFTPLKETPSPQASCFALKEGLLVGGGPTTLNFWDLKEERQLETRDVCQNFQIATGTRYLSTLALSSERRLLAYGDDRGFVTLSALDLAEATEETSLPIPLIQKGEIQELKPMGEGGNFSSLFKGVWKGAPVAFKELKPPPGGDREMQKQDFIREVKTMSELRFHPHLTTLYGYCLDPFALVMPFEEGGTLNKRIESGRPLSSQERRQLALDVVDGLQEIHRRNILHADLKSENILLGSKGEAKIADFGQAKLSSYSAPLYVEQTGDYLWQAPEILEQILAWYAKGGTKPSVIYTQAADIYSLALVLSHLFTARFPFEGTSPSEKEIIEGKRPKIDDLPSVARELIHACWHKDPHQRPSLETIRRTLETLPLEFILGLPLLANTQPPTQTSTPSLFRCPPPSHNFTGRIRELQSLKEAFQTSSRVAIQGLGGMGKTTLSQKFVEDQRYLYPLLYSVSGETPQTLEQGLLDLAKELNIYGDKPEERLSALKRYLEKRPEPFLLLFDGVDSEESFEALGKHLPSRKGTVLITTRRESGALRLGFTCCPLMPLDKGEAVDYLLHVTKSQEKNHALTIVDRLGALPLALEHAASYIRDNCSLAEYISLFDAYRLRLFSDTLSAPDPSRTILTTWQVSLEAIEKTHRCPLAAKVLSFACFLGPEPLPFFLFEAWLSSAAKESDLLELNRALRLLKDYSLLTRNEKETYHFHPLFQEVIRDQLTPEKKTSCLSQALQALIACVKDKDPDHPTNWPLYQRLSAPCDALKQECEAYVKVTPFPLVNPAFLFHQYSRYLRDQGLYNSSHQLCTFTLNITRKIESEGHPEVASDVATSLNCLANVLCEQGNFVEAEKLHREALEIRCRLHPSREHPYVAHSLNNLASVLADQGNFVEEEKLYREALEIRCRLYPSREHRDVAESLDNLAETLSDQGNFVEAEKLHREALGIYCRLYPSREHPDVAMSLDNLAETLSDQGNFVEAEKLHREALGIYCRLYPSREHPYVADSLNGLAVALCGQGEVGEAEKFYREALEIRCHFYPSLEHPDVAKSLNGLAMVLEKQGKSSEAEQLRASIRIPG